MISFHEIAGMSGGASGQVPIDTHCRGAGSAPFRPFGRAIGQKLRDTQDLDADRTSPAPAGLVGHRRQDAHSAVADEHPSRASGSDGERHLARDTHRRTALSVSPFRASGTSGRPIRH